MSFSGRATGMHSSRRLQLEQATCRVRVAPAGSTGTVARRGAAAGAAEGGGTGEEEDTVSGSRAVEYTAVGLAPLSWVRREAGRWGHHRPGRRAKV